MYIFHSSSNLNLFLSLLYHHGFMDIYIFFNGVIIHCCHYLFSCLDCPDLASGNFFNLFSMSFWHVLISLCIVQTSCSKVFQAHLVLCPKSRFSHFFKEQVLFSGSELLHGHPSSHHGPLFVSCCLLFLASSNSFWTKLFRKKKGTFCFDLITYVSSV